MTFLKALDKHGQDLAIPVTGAVLDNALGNPAAITVPGRYIVPATGTAGVFVGQEGKLADFNGETFVFSAAPNGFKAEINTGVNAGSLATFNGTTWAAVGAAGADITYQASGTTKPATPNKGDLLFITSDGTRDGTMTEEWIYDGVAWVLTEGSTAVSGSVLDNTITNSALVTVPGRYIVPTTDLAGDFVGQADKYADWSGSYDETDPLNPVPTGFVFTAPDAGDTILLNSGTNAGQVWKYTTAWAQLTKTTGLSAYNYNQASAYKATDLVVKDNIWYQANSNISAGTAFIIGTSGASWKTVGASGGSKSYAKYKRTAAQTGLVANSAIIFTSPELVAGTDISFGTTNGNISLKAGKTYRLRGTVGVALRNSASPCGLMYQWYNVTAGAYVGMPVQINSPTTSLNTAYVGGPAEYTFTPASDTVMQLRVFNLTNVSGVGNDPTNAPNQYPWAEVEQLGTTEANAFIGSMQPTYSAANTYLSGTIVVKDGFLYLANAAIPVGTAFTVGTTGATWSQLNGTAPSRIVVNETVTISGSTTNPTKSTVMTKDTITLIDDGSGWCTVDMELIFAKAGTGATSGSGVYLFTLPGGRQFDLARHPANTVATPGTQQGVVETAKYLPAGTGLLTTAPLDVSQDATAVPHNATQFKLITRSTAIAGGASSVAIRAFTGAGFFTITPGTGGNAAYVVSFRFKKA